MIPLLRRLGLLLQLSQDLFHSYSWRIITLRVIVNISVVILLAVSAYAVVYVVSDSDDSAKTRNWWRENETTVVVTVITTTFPVFFELLGFLEHYHPRKQLRLQLARYILFNFQFASYFLIKKKLINERTTFSKIV